MSYDITIARKFDDEFEPLGYFENKKLVEILKKHPEVSQNEDGLWGYGDEETGFAISFEEEEERSPDITIFFPYFRINMEQRYRNAAEFAIWLADQLNAKVYDYQIGKMLNQEVVEDALRESPMSVKKVRKKSVEDNRNNETVYIFIFVIIFIVIFCLRRLACHGSI